MDAQSGRGLKVNMDCMRVNLKKSGPTFFKFNKGKLHEGIIDISQK